MPIIESGISQHAEDAAYLWLLRDAACHEPHYRLKDLAKLNDRVEAHRDGLRIAGGKGRDVCAGVWTMKDSCENFATSELASESSDPNRIEAVLEIAASAPELSRGAVSALGPGFETHRSPARIRGYKPSPHRPCGERCTPQRPRGRPCWRSGQRGPTAQGPCSESGGAVGPH
jgi:hypothetical protein